ncbi:MAG: Sua5/YciO/YrdC/YwlC family protein [Candidatus Pelagadaptatus aseana]|uniref:L-threonylcarbamoyladenylate synthase n=1 Tax=Candidatus Pelagadaptatus aseana TaxID=3120508 RepID=UPI0039B17DCE
MDWSRHPKIQRTADLMWGGAVIAYPTEAVWGLGCAPHDEQAVYRILALKKRSMSKGLILVASSMAQIEYLLRPLSEDQRQQMAASWPGPVTWLIPDLEDQVPDWIKGQFDSVAVRVTDHPLVCGLCDAFGGPIVSTSANPQGLQPALEGWQVRRYFGDSVDVITPGRVGGNANPSEIRDLRTGRIIRNS